MYHLSKRILRQKAATEQILGMFRPMLLRYSLVNGRFDEDLYHELIVEALKCIHYFRKLES